MRALPFCSVRLQPDVAGCAQRASPLLTDGDFQPALEEGMRQQIFDSLTSTNTNPTLQKVEGEEAPKLAAHDDEILHAHRQHRLRNIDPALLRGSNSQLRRSMTTARVATIAVSPRWVLCGYRLRGSRSYRARSRRSALATTTTVAPMSASTAIHSVAMPAMASARNAAFRQSEIATLVLTLPIVARDRRRA